MIDKSSGYKNPSFKDAYSTYNQIKVEPLDAPKMTFMSGNGNYYYKFMPFRLRNANSIYKRLMGTVFSYQIGCNLEVCVDDMIVKTSEKGSHCKYLGDILNSV